MASLAQQHDPVAPRGAREGITVVRLHRRHGGAGADTSLPPAGPLASARALERLRSALAAEHVAVIAWSSATGHGEVASVAGAALIAPGMALTRSSSLVVGRALDGEPAAHAVARTGTGLEALAAAAGMETAMALPVEGADGGVDGVVYVAWTGAAAPVELAQTTVASEAEALAALLRPPAIVGARVLVCHQDRLVAAGISRHAERRLGVLVDCCTTLEDLLVAVDAARPDLIACGEALDEGEELAAVAARIRAAGSAAPILALARTETARSIDQALRAGIAGYVAVSQGADRILEAMAAVLDGRAVLPSHAGDDHRAPDLTAREREVLDGLDRGLSYVAIAGELQVAPSTVKSHARQLFRKLDVGSRTAALHKARSEGLL